MATKKTAESPEFMYLPIGSIIVEEQIRSKIDMTSESFKALMESIRDRGVLEPVLVTQKDDKYLLLCGERRYLAAQKLGHESIPARIVNTVTQKDEILAIQLVENLQRADESHRSGKGDIGIYSGKTSGPVRRGRGTGGECIQYG